MRRIRVDPPFLAGIICAIATTLALHARAENLTFSGTGTVRILASDWGAYIGGNSTFDAGINDWGRLYWRGTAGDGQYIHFDLTRLQGLTMQSTANVTLQNTNATWGGSVSNSFIASANGAWTAANGAALPGATAIGDATNATGDYGSGTSITWGIGSSTFQGYVTNASSFNGLAIIGGNGSTMHFTGPLSPYLTVATSATMSDVVTVSGGAAWNSSNYSFADGVLTINDAVAGGQSGAGNVTISALGTVFVNGDSGDNRYWAVDSTRVNAGGVLLSYGHSHLHNLTLAGGELAGIRPNGTWGGWTFDDATTVTGGVTSTISAQQVNLDNGTFSVDAGSTLDFPGSIRSGSITKNGAGTMRLTSSGIGGTPVNTQSGSTVINGGTIEIYGRSADNGGYTSLGTGAVTINNGGTLVSANDWSTGNEWNGGTVGTITINNGGTWTINTAGNTVRNGLVLNGGTINGTGANGDWGGMYLRSTSVTAGGNATSTIAVDTAMNEATTMTVDGGSQLNFSGVIHNKVNATGGVTKAGAGTLVLSGSNSYSGGTALTAGTLRLESTSALGSGGLSMADGTTLQLRSDSIATFAGGNNLGGLGGAGITFDVNRLTGGASGQTLTFAPAGFNTSATTINVTGGNGYTLALGGINEGYNGALTLNAVSANLQIGAIGSSSAVGSLTVGGAANTTITGAVATNGGLTKTGAGTLVLSAANSYTGNTTVSAGTLIAQSTYASSGFAVASGAVLEFDVASGSQDSATTTFSGSGTLRKTGAGELRWGSTTATFGFSPGALVDVQAGTFVAGSNANENWSSNQSDLNVASGAVFNTVEANVRVNTITGSGTILTGYSGAGYQNFTFGVGNGSSTFAGVIADAVSRGSLVKAGTGTVTLSGSNTYSGQTDITAGTLVASNNAALGPGGLDGNTMTWVRSGATLGLQGNISSDEHLHVVGTGVGGLGAIRNVSGDNTMTNWIGFDGNTTFGVDAGTLTLTNRLYGDGDYNASSLTKVGAGTLVLQGNNVLTGGLIVDSGTVIANRSPQDFGGDSSLGDGIVTVNNGGTLRSTAQWTTGSPWQPRTVGAVTINNGGTWSIEALGQMVKNGLYLNGGTITGAGANTDWGGLNLSSDLTASGSAVSSVGVDTALNGGRTITVDGGSQLNYSGVLHNQYESTGAITKAGAGVLVLSGINTYSGATTLSAGTLRLESTSALGSGVLGMANGTTLQLRSDSSVTFAGGNSLGGLGGASITIDVNRLTSGASGETLSFAPAGFDTANTTINVTGGNDYTLALGGINQGHNAPLTLNAVSANLQIGAIGSSSAVGSLTVGGAANTTITGAVATNGGLTKTGAGLLTLSGVSSYAGDTTISSGTLALGGSGQLGGGSYAGAVTNNAAFLITSAANQTFSGNVANAGTIAVSSAANQTLSGVVSGAGSFTKSGAGTLTLTNGANSFTSGITVSSGVLAFAAGGLGTTGTVSMLGGTLRWDGGNTEDISARLAVTNSSTTTLDVGSNDVTLASPFGNTASATVVKTGAGILALTGANDYTGGTEVNAGTLAFADGGLGTTGSVTLAASTVLQWAAGNTQDISSRLVLPGSGGVTLDTGTNVVALANGLGAGSSVAITKTGAGTLALSGSNGSSGATTISQGTLALTGAGTLGASAVNLAAAGATLDVSGVSGGGATIAGLSGAAGSSIQLGGRTLTANITGDPTTYGGVISGSGGFTKAGASRLVLTNAQAFTGRLTVSAGELEVNADNLLQSAGSILVGTAADTDAALSASSGSLTVFAGQTLGGYGTVFGDVNFAPGAVLSPGGSVGELDGVGGSTFNGGMTYVFEINDSGSSAVPGGPNGWDLYSTDGVLTLAAGSEFANQIVIDLTSLSGTGSGLAANFDPARAYAWRFAVAGAEITTFDAGWFRVNTTNFQNLSGNPERFSVALGGTASLTGTGNQALYVVYASVPEPGTLALAGIGLAAAALASRRRRPGGVR